MATIITRAGKGSFLTNDEVDSNFINLNVDISNLNLDISGLNGDIASLNVDISNLNLDISGLNGDIASLNVDISNLNDDVATRLLSSSYTPADILSKLTTVDGTGSGLDADLVQGLGSSSTLPVSGDKSSVVTRNSSGDIEANVFTGALTGTADSAVDLIGGAANRIVYQDSINSTAFLPAPTVVGDILKWTATGYQWGKAADELPVGTIINHSGTTAPAGFLVCPVSLTLINISTYPDLYDVIGTSYGGDGITTFGLPYIEEGGALVQASGNVGSTTVGEIKSHNHTTPIYSYGSVGSITTIGGVLLNSSSITHHPSSANGGSRNLAAGVKTLICIKY